MQLIRRNRTIGALNRRFERDRVFQVSDTVSGPAVTPADTANGDLALRYGTYPATPRPKAKTVGRFGAVWGQTAAQWARLSDVESNFLVLGKRLAVMW